MKNKINLLKYTINYLSKFSSSKKNLELILKLKIQRITKDKKERFELYKEMIDIFKNLEKNNLINDERYSFNKIIFFANQGKSKNYIIQYLYSKGIEKKLIEKQLINFEEQNSNWEEEAAIIFVKKKFLKNSKISYEKKISRMARAGFNYELCKKILN